MAEELDVASSLLTPEVLRPATAPDADTAGNPSCPGRRRRRRRRGGRGHAEEPCASRQDRAEGPRRSRHGRDEPHSDSRTLPRGSLEKPLADARSGSQVRVSKVHGDDRFRGKMIALGILPGTPISVLKGGGRRPLLVAVDGSRFCIDQESSRKITVRDR